MFDRKQYVRDMKKLRGKPYRHHRRKSACGKVSYESKTEAVGVATTRLRPSDNSPASLRPYECPECLEWHLTSKRGYY